MGCPVNAPLTASLGNAGHLPFVVMMCIMDRSHPARNMMERGGVAPGLNWGVVCFVFHCFIFFFNVSNKNDLSSTGCSCAVNFYGVSSTNLHLIYNLGSHVKLQELRAFSLNCSRWQQETPYYNPIILPSHLPWIQLPLLSLTWFSVLGTSGLGYI